MRTLKQVGQGKMDERLVATSSDEFGELTTIFNEMIVRIRKNRESVENKVLRRTKELEKFNKLMVGREVKMIELKKEVDDLELGLKNSKAKSWNQKFKDAVEVEEDVIRELESVYLYKVKMSNMNEKNKKKVVKLLKKLVKDSERHDEIFKKLAQENG